eukprot:838842_1
MCADVGDYLGKNTSRQFSDTSISWMNKCLADNTKLLKNYTFTTTAFGECGNGIHEYGEECDCGREDCIGFDNCCDGRKCMITRYTCRKVTDMSQLSPVFPIVVAVIMVLLFSGALYESGGSISALQENIITVLKYPYRQQKKFRRNLKQMVRRGPRVERKEDN